MISLFAETDLIPAFATFLSCLFLRLELGIVVGIAINVVFLLYASARPSVNVEKVTVRYFIIYKIKFKKINDSGYKIVS